MSYPSKLRPGEGPYSLLTNHPHGHSTSPGPDGDIACTHARNSELRDTAVTKACFKIFNNLSSLTNEQSRTRIGFMPGKWSNKAIPLFNDGDADYQLHLSYTWLKVIHTYSETWRELESGESESEESESEEPGSERPEPEELGSEESESEKSEFEGAEPMELEFEESEPEEPEFEGTGLSELDPGLADWNLHGVAGITENGHVEVIVNPLAVIPIGKLFINKAGYSTWTGYEMFVSGNLEVWIIYVPNEDSPVVWNITETDPFNPPIGDQQPHRTGTRMLAQFCQSLRDLETTTFEAVKRRVASTRDLRFTKFYLLEISPRCIRSSHFPFLSPEYYDQLCVELSSDRLRVECYPKPNPAYQQLLLLAKENPNIAFVELSFKSAATGPDERVNENWPELSLLSLAAASRSRRVFDCYLIAATSTTTHTKATL
ncbi:hypothetical protein F5Y10DRAFT_270506 [Nemania abortiva]|nr:hypothetical protein F5Y10DRAFT_270506 [Nemania abortiva]